MDSKQVSIGIVQQLSTLPHVGAAGTTDSASRQHRNAWRAGITRGAALLALCAALGGCGLAAAPCRVASAGLKIIPVVGHVAATPTDACADVIDP